MCAATLIDKTPRNIIYTLAHSVPLTNLETSAFTDVIASFLLPQADGSITPSNELNFFLNQPGLMAGIKANGKRHVLVSLGGEAIPAGGWEALAKDVTTAASKLISFAQQYGFDGIDIDYEDTDAFNGSSSYDAVQFLIALSKAIKAQNANCLVTHAPRAPHLYDAYTPGGATNSSNAYRAILSEAGDAIDWLNIQYYNNPWYVGDTVAEQVEHIVGSGVAPFASSIKALAAAGLDISKLVVGKPSSAADAGSGFLSAADVANSLLTPLKGSGFGGVMAWQYDLLEGGQTADAWGSTMAQAL